MQWITDVLDMPTWLVALSAFILTYTILRNGKNTFIPIRIFALNSIAQMTLYIIFSLFDLPAEVRQISARSLAITMNISLTILISVGRL
jgi:hypothetical protein